MNEKVDYSYINESFLKSLGEMNGNLRKISISNNVLSFNGKSIDLTGFDLRSIFNNESDIVHNIEEMSEMDIFNIVSIYQRKRMMSLDTLHRAWGLINSNQVYNPEDKAFIDNFNSYIYDLLKYRDYLDNETRKTLDNFEKAMYNLEIKKETDVLSQNQSSELDIFNDMAHNVQSEMNEKIRKEDKALKRTLRMNNLAGFSNAFMVILSTLLLGIVLCIMLLIIR